MQQNNTISLRGKIYTIFASSLIIVSSLNRELKLSSVDYLLYGIFFIYSANLIFTQKRHSLPKRYFSLLLLFLSLLLLNSFVTRYHIPVHYYIVGIIITSLPFIHFFISYNENLNFNEIFYIVDKIISTILVCAILVSLETIMLGNVESDGSGFVHTKLFMLGFIASLCNQGVILSLACYHLTRRKKYIRIVLFLILFIVLINQLKAVASMIFVLSIYFLYMRKGNVMRRIGLACITLVISFQVLMFIPVVHDKVVRYSEMYGGESAKDGIARVALYYTAIEIANDHFPFGTGQGTYGSIACNLSGINRVYEDYGISNIYGISLNTRDVADYRLDAFIASVLGEQGYLSIIVYLGLLFYPFLYLRINTMGNSRRQYMLFVSGLTLISILFESFTLALMNRFAFIFIYSGLAAMFVKNVAKDVNNNVVNRKGF